ncbi:MAG: UDP-3-O-acyl-N-acetylglucosamine deacetylase [Hyphomicrobiales bacterium]|nr:UDP-3-O-acyl-N-acetylglucosamine deacetylase [Hyphomicrobiales bacterium]
MSFNGWGDYQTTIGREIVLQGIGVHGGKEVSLVLHPATANSGYNFYLKAQNGSLNHIPGDFRFVNNVTLCTILAGANGATVATVEHLLAALRGMGVDNVDIEVDSAEIPIMDGSSEPFVKAIDMAGVRNLAEPRKYIRVTRPVRIEEGDMVAEFTPYNGFKVDVEIDFDTPVIGRQRMAIDVTPANFRRELCRARTFGFMRDVKKLWACGRALGASLENTVAVGDDRVMNPEGLRFSDEFARHKALDAVGDLSLAGAPILGAFRSIRGGHKLNSMMLHALFAAKSSWEIVETVRKPRFADAIGHAEIGFGIPQPAFAPPKA